MFNTVRGTISGGNHPVLWRIFRTAQGYHQYCGEISSVLWRMFRTTEAIPTVLLRDTISAVEDIQCCGRIAPVVRGNIISTVRGSIQFIGGCSVLWRETTSTMEVINTE